MKPIAWYDPSNGEVSTDRDCPAFTPLGQVWPLFLEKQQITADCPKCEYNKNRASRWRAEAYKQAGHDVIQLPWVGLTGLEQKELMAMSARDAVFATETKLKEKNT